MSVVNLNAMFGATGPGTKDIIVRLLANLGSRREVDQYLRHYSSVDTQKFAIIKVGGSILEHKLDTLASALSFLQTVGLLPIVIHGAAPQLAHALEAAGVPDQQIGDHRVTTPSVLDVGRKVLMKENLRLVEALESLGTRARPISGGVFEARRVADSRVGLVGEVTGVHEDTIQSAIRSGHLPIIAPLGETAEGQILGLSADHAAYRLACHVRPHKLILLTESGGILDDEGQIFSAINLEEDYETLIQKEWIHEDMRERLADLKGLLEELPSSTSISITSPEQLAKELFTHKGAGTLVRLGERVRTYESFAELDQPRLAALLEACFGRRLSPSYFRDKKPYRVYLADSYRATAIVTREAGIPYLDKFAVTTEAQGAGIGGSIWLRMTHENPKLFWRARADNAINPWYFQNSDGAYKTDRWVVFWIGLEGWDEIRECTERALALPATLKEHGTGDLSPMISHAVSS